MTDLIADLDEVVRLSERATPGKWSVEAEGKNDFGQPEFTIEIFDGKCPIVDSGSFYGDPEDANLSASAVNFIRAHAAEIEAMARDAERWKGVESVMAMMADKVEGRITSACGLLLIDYAARINAGKVELRFGGVSDAETGEIGDWTICIEKAAMRSAKENQNG